MIGRLIGLLVVLPLMLTCARHPSAIRMRMLATVACFFFAYETYCILYKPPDTVFGVSEQCVRFFALSVLCPLFVWCAHRLLHHDSQHSTPKALLCMSAACFFIYETAMLLKRIYNPNECVHASRAQTIADKAPCPEKCRSDRECYPPCAKESPDASDKSRS